MQNDSNRWRHCLSLDPAATPEREVGGRAGVHAHHRKHESAGAGEGPSIHVRLRHIIKDSTGRSDVVRLEKTVL